MTLRSLHRHNAASSDVPCEHSHLHRGLGIHSRAVREQRRQFKSDNYLHEVGQLE